MGYWSPCVLFLRAGCSPGLAAFLGTEDQRESVNNTEEATTINGPVGHPFPIVLTKVPTKPEPPPNMADKMTIILKD